MSSDLAAANRPDVTNRRPWSPSRWLREPGRGWDLMVVAIMVAAAFWVFAELWLGGGSRVLHGNADDQALFEWMFTHAANSVTNLSNPLLAPELGVPHTANLMGNTSVLLLAIPLTPVTLLFGASISFALSATVALAGTAIAWYIFMRRRLEIGRVAACCGALFCGFAPGIVSQAVGHPHIAVQALVPLLIALSLDLGKPGRTRRTGILLGLTATAQLLLGEEVLLLTAMGMAFFVAAYAVLRWSEVKTRIRGALGSLAIAFGVVILLAGYPLYVQFLSPYAYHTIPNSIYSADLASYVTYATNSIAGTAEGAKAVAPNASEETAFFGWPLVVVILIAGVWLWRQVWVRAMILTGLAFFAFSLGVTVRWHKKSTGIPGPWRIFDELPIFHDIITARLALALIPIMGLLLALSWQAARQAVRFRQLRWLWPVAIIAALIPAAPRSLDAHDPGQPIPAFVTAGDWRECTSPGGTLVAYPVGVGRMGKTQMRWQNAAKLEFGVTNGYYISRAADGKGQWGQPSRPTDLLVYKVIKTSAAEPVTPEVRAATQADLAYWKADCVAVEADRPQIEALKTTLTEAIGSTPQYAGGVWYWDVTP